MITKIDKAKEIAPGVLENSGSCVKLAGYTSKETNAEKTFFSHTENYVPLSEVIHKIDNNKRTLKRRQEKFYSLNYDPSEKEIRFFVYKVTGKKVDTLEQLSFKDRKKVFDEFREYVRGCMDIYAKSFYRERELSANDLVYFGHIEETRYYTKESPEVREGLKKIGEKKPGLHMHAHIIVSRMDATQTVALSPRAKARESINKLNGKSVKCGFHLKKWHQGCVELFSNKYVCIDSYYQHKQQIYRTDEFLRTTKAQIIKEAMEGMEEEKRVLGNVNKIIRITRSPKKMMKGYLKRKIKDILFSNEPCI